jgi:hypothetical protein
MGPIAYISPTTGSVIAQSITRTYADPGQGGPTMADFRTHITTSTLMGIGYGSAGYAAGLPLSTCMVATGLCSVSGMLPDLDSDSGIPLRECTMFAAAVAPMLMLDRFQQMGLTNETMALAAGLIYLTIRFVVAEVFRRYTVHRGMWHSIPAAVTMGLVAFLVISSEDMTLRLYKTFAVVLGFMIHLILDELWSIEIRRGRLRLKRSFGTAMKFWSGRSTWANVSTYGKLILFAALAASDPVVMRSYFPDESVQPRQATRESTREASLDDHDRVLR